MIISSDTPSGTHQAPSLKPRTAAQSGVPEVRIRGAGVVGTTLALGLSAMGIGAVIEKANRSSPDGEEVRAYAINHASQQLLERLKVWGAIPAAAICPVQDMDVYGDGKGGQLSFSAWQQKVDALAWIVDASALEAALHQALQFASHIRVDVPTVAADRATMAQGADLLVLCEGRDSAAREKLGVEWDVQSYGHSALAMRLVCDVAHAGVAQQWFLSPDILALLPCNQPEPGSSYAMIWSMPSEQAQQWMQADELAFEAHLQQTLQKAHHAGGGARTFKLAGARRVWPLHKGHAQRVSGQGWVMLGDCAHVIHPLAGQGLNLGLADVAELLRILSQRESWRSLGDARLLARYERARWGDIRAMTTVTDGLWHLFQNPMPWVQVMRNQGMGWLDRVDFLKKKCVEAALG